jgi:hypothetical protein
MNSHSDPPHENIPHFDLGMQERQKRIRELAYFKAKARGFAPGHELDDWLEAEREVDEAMRPLPTY